MTGTLRDGVHRLELRVYYEDTDAAGIVYYANYLRFAERARTELLRLLGVEQRRLMEEDGTGFAVRRCEIDYLKPARLDSLLTVTTRTLSISGARLVLAQEVLEGETPLARLVVTLVLLDRRLRPRPLPPGLRGLFAATRQKA